MNWQKPAADWVDITSLNLLDSTTISTKLCSAVQGSAYTLANRNSVRIGTHDPFPPQSSIVFAPNSGATSNTRLSRLTYWPARLPNPTLQRLTQ